MRRVALSFALVAAAAPAMAGQSILDRVLVAPMLAVEPGTGAGMELSLRRGDTVTTARILPVRAVALSNDVKVPDKDMILPKGTVLSLYRAATGDVFCSARTVKLRAGNIPCLLDSDGDGKFDRAMRIQLAEEANRLRAGVFVRSSSAAISPVGSTPLNPADYPVDMVRLVLTGGGSDNASFQVVGTILGKEVPISGTRRTGKGVFPVDVEVFGARLTILSYEKGVNRVRIMNAIPAQRFLLSAGMM